MIKRRKYTPEYKARIVLEIRTEQKSIAQASREYKIKDPARSRWKQEFMQRLPMLFKQGTTNNEQEQRVAALERMAGQNWKCQKKYPGS